MKALHITNWEDHYETAESRRIKATTWVATPNGHNSVGFRRLLKHANGMAHYGAWNLILQTASKCSPRGLLMFGGVGKREPHTAETIADVTGGSEKIMAEAIARLLQIGWLEEVDCDAQRSAGRGQQTAGHEQLGGEGRGQDGTGREGTPPPACVLLIAALKAAKAAGHVLPREQEALDEWIALTTNDCGCEFDADAAEAVRWMIGKAKQNGIAVRYARQVADQAAACKCHIDAWKAKA